MYVGALIATAVCAALPTRTGAAALPDSLSLQTTTAQTGYIGLAVTGPPEAQVALYEHVGTAYQPIATVVLANDGSASVPKAATWLCDRRARQFAAVTRPPAPPEYATASANTPSCAGRLELRAPRNAEVDRRLKLAVSDRWRLGDIRFRTCLTPPGGRTGCRSSALRPGQRTSERSVVLPRPGGWSVSLRTAYDKPGSRLIWTMHANHRIRLLAAGDSEMQILDDYIGNDLHRYGVDVTGDARISTGLTNSFYFDWPAHAQRQAPTLRPDVTVIAMGANDGFPVQDGGHRADCCGRAWSAGYAALVASMMQTYLRGDAGRIYWYLLATPRPFKFRRLFDAVNLGIREAAARFPGRVELIDANAVFTPGDHYRDFMSFDGRGFTIHEADGIHLSAASDTVAAKLLVQRLLADRVIH